MRSRIRCVILVNMRNREKTEKSFENRLSLLQFFLQGSVCLFVSAMIAASAVSFADMLLPRIMTFTVDSVIGDLEPRLSPYFLGLLERAGGAGIFRRQPYLIALLVAATAAAGAVCRYLFRYFNEAGAERMVKRMRVSLYDHIVHLPYAWHGSNSTGDILQRCTSDVETIREFVSEQLTSLVRVAVLIVLAVWFMAQISLKMTAAASVFIPVLVGYSVFFYSKTGSAFLKADEEESTLSAIAQENLTGVRVVRAFGRERYERERFEKQNEYYTGLWIRLIKILSLNWMTGDLLTGLQYLLVMVTGSVFCVRGEITPGEFIAFVSYNSMLTWPVRRLGRVISEMSKAGISLERLRYIMAEGTEHDPENALEPPMDRDITFRNVSFSYEDASGEALTDVSLTIPAHATVGILGGTGSGKSTLMYLLEKLYPLAPGQGQILIGDTDLADISTPYLRSQIGMVLQEPYLFSGTIADNIGIASPEEVDEDELQDVTMKADLLNTVRRFPKGFATKVGERGVTLSGGQKQRTAIAQMLVRKTPVMIFDDSLSAVDAETDDRIRRALRAASGEATVIIIAHRVMTLMHADRIFVLDRGRVAEEGTHEELYRKGGIYRRICDLQSGGGDEGAEEAGRTAGSPLKGKAGQRPDPAGKEGGHEEKV